MESATLSRAANASSKSRPSLLAGLRKPEATSSDSSAESDNDSNDSDHASVHAIVHTLSPRSNKSRRTSPQPTANTLENEEKDDSDDDGAAYERMKQRLAAAKALKAAPQQNAPVKEQSIPAADVSSEEDDMPVQNKARRLVTRKEKSASPPASPLSVRSRRSSPGLFVTPNASPAKQQPNNNTHSGSESDASSRPRRTNDFQERVRRIRAERLAKQQEEQTQQEKQKATSKAINRRLQQDEDSGSDGENGRRLTQQAKPTRKAGKKALEAMARDQQRISRNMQLTHQAKTRKKHTVKDLFSRFGFDTSNGNDTAAETLPTPAPSSALASSDAEANQSHETPPTSPPTVEEQEPEKVTTESMDVVQQVSSEVQSKEVSPPRKLDKGKGRAPEFQHLPPHPWMKQTEQTIVQTARVTPKPSNEALIELSDSDDDEAVQTARRFPVFDRIPLKKTQEASSLLHLRHLAHLTSPKDVRKGVKSISFAEMQMSLAQKARQQAQNEREEKIAELRRRGVYIETEEEREKNQMEIEDMVAQLEKQRQEDLKLAKLERDEAKKNGETIDDLPSSDESDDDYVGSGEENEEAAEEEEGEEEVELVLSGSEDEDMEDDVAQDMDDNNPLVDDEAEPEATPQGQQLDEDADMEDEEISAPIRKRTANRARNVVVDDEDDEDDNPAPIASPTQAATQNDAMAAFGFGNAEGGLGLTQMFAGTMANLESGSQDAEAARREPEQNSLDFLRSLPDTQPGANFSQTSDFMVPNSQSLMSPQKESQNGAETQFSLGISQLIQTSPAFPRTQLEDLPEPTQDAGFSFSRSPAGLMPPPSTVDTVMMTVTESPIKQRKNKLQRGRKSAAVELSDVEEDLIADEAEADLSNEDDIQRPPKPRDAFAKLAKGAKKQKAMADFDKKNSLAKNAVMEQAEESEDEYAGIGGASDDDSGEEDEETKQMIEHGEVEVDERQLAAFYADKTKKEDEKNFNELYKNVMNGGLRRRAGGRDGFNMSDSEDEEDMRLRKKRAEFQKMSKALLADERIGNIAKDQKKQAFFHTLADFADEGDYEFLDMPAEPSMYMEASQSQEQQEEQDVTVPDSQADATDMLAPANPLKRKSPSDSQKENRPPPNLRRTAAADGLSRKPITLADVQHSVSELLEDPRVMVPDSQYSDSESEGESPAPNAASRKTIVDRLSLSRTSSTSSSTGDADAGGLAFHAPSRSSHAPGFRVPSLIRQATSNLSATSESRRSSGANTPTESVRRGGTGKSNIHAQAREAERRQLLEKKESKRKEALKKKVSAGRKAGMRSVLGDLGGGFE